MISSRLLIFCSIVIFLSACTQVSQKDLYGVYIAEYSFGTEKLTLKENGEYQQDVNIGGKSKTILHKGLWKYDPEDKYVELENALSVQGPFGDLNPNYSIPFDGLVLRKVKRFFPWSPIRLASGNEEIDFVKKKK